MSNFRLLTSLRNHVRNVQHPLYYYPSILWCMFGSATKYGDIRPAQCRNRVKMPDIFRLLPEVQVDLTALNSAITSAYHSPES